MSPLFAELDYQVTPFGTLVLRRRRDLTTGDDIYEIKLNDEFLMSSKFTASEQVLGRVALEGLPGNDLRIAVGGLGLGYTAVAALENPKVRSMLVIDALGPVIEWHQSGLLPLGKVLAADKRCRLVQGDFFAMAASPETGFDPLNPGSRFDAILLDIDHSPHEVLKPSNAALYTFEGLKKLSEHLLAGGVFALWSNNQEDAAFTAVLGAAFGEARAEAVVFDNPLQGREARQCIYLARKAGGAG
ncbi:spermidine synthase [Phyllobacterium phragmitis]|uniref:Spermidine synthase n=1 Tax=Phyllobacterium phragmitis TaxID=2670329 RepID=A0A2S9IT84_9HYPH|nr:spermidine synthase [Phyllobacterium phragmitis]PRD43739.1 spermidine synthase [Phyllobacterium phragmitis]